jgi:uncharacterized protein (TIGR03000 family)
MFAARTAFTFGLALAFCFFAGGFTGMSNAQDKKDEKKDEKKKVISKIKITVPDENSELTIEKMLMPMPKVASTVREYQTPELEADKKYEYFFSVVWNPNNYTTMTRTKNIEFKAGEDLVVDLTKVDLKSDKAKIRWVPTPDDIVDKMVELAGVKDGDVVYEPGPGDGRVLIAAVKKGAKKAVGIEIDHKKVEEAVDNVKKAKLDEKIKIIEGDALKDRDYTEATVVMLYMGNEFNDLLRPILEKQLKPGSRIVSHRFIMGDWKPEKTIKVMGADGDEYVLHLWTIKK